MMLPDSDDMHWQDDWPVFGVEGNASELLGNLLSLIDTLVKWQSYLSESHATSEWMSAIPELIDDMYAPDLDAGVQLQRVRDAVMRWQEQLSDADYSADLSPQVVRSWFNENLAQQGGWQRFLAGPVNFCTLMPMRSIPFKAVCLLGMNDQDYPRPVTPVGFDLMVTGKARRGDRSRREDDRYLVLEALCSAQHYFYISYRGRDARENHELQPSVLINELLDYVGDAYCLEGDEKYPAKQSRENLRQWLIEELPLQPFNRRTFSKEKNGMPQEAGTGIVSFHKLWSSVTNAEFSDSTIFPFYESPLALPEEFSLNHVLWSDVKDALLKPADFFLRRRLRLSPELYFKDSNNEETFAPNNLENAILRTQWVEDQITSSAQTTHGFTAREQALGHLPVNGLGILQSESFSRELDELVERLQGLCAQPLNNTEKDDTSLTITRDVILNSGEVVHCQVSGELTQCYQRQLVHWRAGELRGQHLLDAWLDLVLVAAAQPERIASAIVIGRDKTKGRLQEFEFNAPSQSEALAYIDHCIQYYRDAWQAPQPVMPGLMWALSQAADDKKEKLILAAAENEFSEFNRTAMQLCRPELAQQLLSTDVADGDANAYDHWLEQYQWLWALPQACLVGGDE
jgi:exodeoxyribonuclease V gamma subunit